jgi:hypothetical protein
VADLLEKSIGKFGPRSNKKAARRKAQEDRANKAERKGRITPLKPVLGTEKGKEGR